LFTRRFVINLIIKVKKGFINRILNEDWVKNEYFVSDNLNGFRVLPYGTFILSKIPVNSFKYTQFPSKMSRKLLTATIIINNESFQISTVHLESLSNSKLRNQQLKIASEVLKDDTSLLMGDFNFDSLKNHIDILPLENDCLKEYFPDFLDLWSHLRNERGYTFDNEVNHMIKGKDRSRYDRIIMKSESWECEKIEIIGNDPIQIDDTVKIFPSDHFGLKVELKYKNIENS
jgi:hypothetical protein